MQNFAARTIVKFILTAFLFIPGFMAMAQADRDRETAIAANNFYKEGKYALALPLYAQLLSNHPGDTRYEYFYGVSRYFTGNIPSDAVKHLEKAAKDNDIPRDVFYYLARCYHLTYHFTEAKEAYLKFKQFASQKQADELEVDLNILMCKTAIQLPDKSEKYLVHDKLITGDDDFLSLYKLDALRDGRILTLTETYKSALDKKKNDRQFLFLEPSGSRMVYASRGVDGENSSDIISVTKKISKWEKPVKITEANSKFDESFPTLAKDGKIIYFSAKSPQSMGGYDIFKIELNAETGKWSKPENMGAPVNSPADDFLFASSVLEHCSYVTTNRDCEQGKICVMKIEVNSPTEGNFLNIKGKFINNDRPNEFQVTIQFFNQDNWKLLGEAKVNTKTGEYNIKLPYVQRYATRIDVVGYSLLLGEFQLRFGKKQVVQEIVLNKQNTGEERFVINNTYPEDLRLILLAENAKAEEEKTEQNIKPVSTYPDPAKAVTPKPVSSSAKKAGVSSSQLKPTKSFLIPAPELIPVRTFNWNAEKAKLLLTLKPKEDAEIVAWAKEAKQKKEIPVAQKPKQEAPTEVPFNLENISLENLQSAQPIAANEAPVTKEQAPITQHPKPKPFITDETESVLVFTESKDLTASVAPDVDSKHPAPNTQHPAPNTQQTSAKEISTPATAPIAERKIISVDFIETKESPVKSTNANLKLRKTQTLASVNISKTLLPFETEQPAELTQEFPSVRPDSEGKREGQGCVTQPTAATAELAEQKTIEPEKPITNIPADGYQKTSAPSENLIVAENKTTQIASGINSVLSQPDNTSAQSNVVITPTSSNENLIYSDNSAQSKKPVQNIPAQNQDAPISKGASLENLTYSDNLSESKKPSQNISVQNEDAAITKGASLENLTYSDNLGRAAKPAEKVVLQNIYAQKQEPIRNNYTASLRYQLKIFQNKSDAQVRAIVKGLGN